MDFNTTWVKFGLESSNFTNKPLNIIKDGDNYFYEVEEAYKKGSVTFDGVLWGFW